MKYFLMYFILVCLIVIYCSDDERNPVIPELTTETVTDIDGNVYKTVTIGDQVWMAENLKVTHYRNGETIFKMTENNTLEGPSTGALCAYDNDSTNVDPYGYLYNGFAVEDNCNIAPEGWHVLTDEEWKELEMYLGMSRSEADESDYRGTDEGSKLKETVTSYWYRHFEVEPKIKIVFIEVRVVYIPEIGLGRSFLGIK